MRFQYSGGVRPESLGEEHANLTSMAAPSQMVVLLQMTGDTVNRLEGQVE